jgi:hypothetical protein
MRYALLSLTLASLLLAPGLACAQPVPIAKIEKVRIGFRPYNEALGFGRFKIGLWTPVYVEITAGPKGLGAQPGDCYVEVETSDFEDVGTIYRTPVRLDPNETGTFIAYTKTGTGGGIPDVKVTLHIGNRTMHPPREGDMAMELQGHVYLALGRRVADLPAALLRKNEKDKDDVQFVDEGRRRAALFEDKVDLLPPHWFGYDGVDLIILSADNREFLTKLADPGHVEQLRALVQWVRRGGRLVIPMSIQTQPLVNNLLTRNAWQPPVPVVPPAQTAEKFPQPERLAGIEAWGEVNNMPLPNPGEKPPSVAQLEPPGAPSGDWDIEARVGNEGPALIARVKYGLGQIVYIAFSLDDPVFSQWPGRHDFLRKAIAKLAPRTGQDIANQPNPGFQFRRQDSSDVTSQLYSALDNFDVRVIPFGVVAIFIVLYVVIVGPLEFVLLKYVFGRLEWTWITFPAVVLGVSVIAYFGAYALKGQDLKVNKVDVVDFDMRTDIDAQRQPKSVRVYGQTFLMILSPRIQSYTVGIEPNPPFWGDEKPAKPLSADLVSWMARPDDGPGGMGRGGGQGFFRKPYYYGTGDAREETLPSGVSGVPIPVWMAKAFCASWEATAATPPVTADLVYHRNPVEGKDIKISGTIRSNLGVDLVDASLFYAEACYPIENGIPGGKGDRQPIKLRLEAGQNERTVSQWLSEPGSGPARPSTSQGMYDPSSIVRQALFHESAGFQTGNHSLRRLDLSWRRYKEPPRALIDRSTREAILVARVQFQTGPLGTLSNDPGNPLPTQLWLGSLPDVGGPRDLAGTLHQDTFIRVILPVRPAGN